jgi:hypothetical protein
MKYNLLTNYQCRHASNEKNTLSLKQNFQNDKTFFNSSDTSRLSTKLNSSESLLFQSFYINKNIRKFQMKNIKLKNKIFSSYKDVTNNSYKNFLRSKIYNNISKISLPEFNNSNENMPSKELNNNNNNNNHSILRKSFSNNIKEINKMSFIELRLRDELLDIFNFKNNRLGCNNYNNKYYFKESTKKRILLKKYIYEQNKNYIKEVKSKNIYEKKINEKSKITNNIYQLIAHNKLNIVTDYNLFLQKKIHQIKEKDFYFCKYIELLKNEIKNLFIKIKIESDKLWFLLDIRNFLICVKESISIKQLPLIFRFYNSDYLDELTKINENDIYLLEKIEKPKKNLNLFRIPTNLLVYIKALNGLDKEIVDKRFSKYLNSNYIIFKNVEEFINKYALTEKTMLNHLRNSLIQNNYNEAEKMKLSKQIKDIEKDNKIFENDYNNTKKVFNEIMSDNIYYNKSFNKVSVLKKIIENVKNVEKDKNYDKDKNKVENIKIENENNEHFLKMISKKKYNFEKNQFLLKYNELKNCKKFKTEKEYVYYFIYKNIFQLFKIYPEYFYKQNKFSLKKMYLYINNIKNCDKFPDPIIQSNVIYLLSIYENAITYFLFDYQKDLEIFGTTNFYNKIKKKVIINKKHMLLKQQKILENKVKKLKFEKYNQKQTKYRYKQRNPVLINSLLQIKKSNSFEHNIKQKDSYYEENNLLSY